MILVHGILWQLAWTPGNMKFDTKLHTNAIRLKTYLGNFLSACNWNFGKRNQLFVLNYHSTPVNFLKNFEAQIILFKEKFEILNPITFEFFFEGQINSDRPCLLLTFDDGLKNNLYSAEILLKHGLNAYYFVIPEFLNTDLSLQRQFYLNNVRNSINFNIDNQNEDFTAMTWEDLNGLLKVGNKIGSHTLTHSIVALDSENMHVRSNQEIIESKIEIETRLSVLVNSFCSIIDTLKSVSAEQKKVIEANYKYHFTTIPGVNFSNSDTLLIKRKNVESYWTDGAVRYALSSIDDYRYYVSLLRYKNL
jgi:peptidoglycan/xylan/chitin deacetylase (PgdA/CDA1 family)